MTTYELKCEVIVLEGYLLGSAKYFILSETTPPEQTKHFNSSSVQQTKVTLPTLSLKRLAPGCCLHTNQLAR